jgi:hypothetical protein
MTISGKGANDLEAGSIDDPPPVVAFIIAIIFIIPALGAIFYLILRSELIICQFFDVTTQAKTSITKVDAENPGSNNGLVFVKGEAKSEEKLTDEVFGFTKTNTLRIRRSVQVLQKPWEQKETWLDTDTSQPIDWPVKS